MPTQELSPERTRAFYKFKEAEQHAAKHRYDQAVAAARDALEVDPTFLDVRHWLANLYQRLDQPRKASLEYQEILHASRNDQQAWTKLREIDSAAAERLERLHDIAPDPFVMARTEATDDLDDLGGLADEFVAEPEEELVLSREAVAVEALEEVAETGGVSAMLQTDVGGVLGITGTAEPAGGPPTWLYEEDLKYRDHLQQHAIYAKLLPKVIEYWKNDGAWDLAISGSVHLDEKRHPEIVKVAFEVQGRMHSPKWALYLCPERRMICCITRGAPPTISLTTGVINNLSHIEQVFILGRFTGMVLAGHVPYIQMCMLTLERSPRTITDVEIDLLELLKKEHSGWDAGVRREERLKLGALCHAWQQRAELSADRAGLIACNDLEAACNGIAKSVAADANAAKVASWKGLVEKFKGQDVAQLAAIPPKEDPARNEGYGLYRIQMLRWWANTPAAKELLATWT